MKVSDFDYDLPADRVAQVPIRPRDAARLLVHDVATGRTAHRLVRDLPGILQMGDCLVVNDTRVRPARLCGRRATGGSVELLVVGPASAPPGAAARWRALVNPARRLRPGERLDLEDGSIDAVAVERLRGEDGREGPEWIFEIADPRRPGVSLEELLESSGRMPLPPYIHRDRGPDPRRDLDREGYQTVFARSPGAIAAPTAGLHFTPELLERLAASGVERATVTLHVGLGTFKPVEVEDVADHRMHAERYELSAEAARAIARARERGGRIVAVGTTVARVLESRADGRGGVSPAAGETALFIRPGFRFQVVDALLTNFHLPRSTLLMLVCAFAGRERALGLYREAIEAGYRFYSYGDAMLLLGEAR